MIRFGPKSETQDAKPAKSKTETVVKDAVSAPEKPAAKATAKAKKPKKTADGTLI